MSKTLLESILDKITIAVCMYTNDFMTFRYMYKVLRELEPFKEFYVV
jgi:hypothetical protein